MTRHAIPGRLATTAFAALLLGLLLGWPALPEAIERRRDQFGKDFGYFVYPIASEIPGLGTATGAGATVLNMFETDADFTGFFLEGDFDASGYALLDMHLIKERLVLDVGTFDFDVAPVVYGRGIDSDKDEVVLPKVKGAYLVGQLTLTFSQRLFEAYVRVADGAQRVLEVRDRDGNVFENIDRSKHDTQQVSVGGILDYTDDRLDPRVGFRIETARKFPKNDDPFVSDYYVTDYNLTGYIPFRRWDTLALNYFRSDAEVTRQGPTDPEELRQYIGLGCDMLSGVAYEQCVVTEEKRISERAAFNANGDATSLGGTQRLRAFPNGRFHAGHAQFVGVEYRWNLSDVREPFDIFVARGIHTGVQLAFFAEQGSVADDVSQLTETTRSSYGMGVRALFSGVILRADWATGEEGSLFQLFINYPWGMFSVDNPG